MAFDLNKNDGSAKDSEGKKFGSAKFDLTKGELKNTIASAGTSKSKNWLVGLVGLLLIGAGGWYFSSDNATKEEGTLAAAKQNSSDNNGASRSVVESGKDSLVVENTDQETTPSVVKDKYSAILSRKTAATFEQGSSSFNKVDQSLIKNLISYLTENPGLAIHVNGYASSDGSIAVNQTVSQARADAFKKYLESKNIAENRVVAIGKGIESPIASNSTNAGRKKNRRVEITLP